jgi:hypothetical protein
VTAAEMSRQLSEAAHTANSISGNTGATNGGSAADIARMATELESAVGAFTF